MRDGRAYIFIQAAINGSVWWKGIDNLTVRVIIVNRRDEKGCGAEMANKPILDCPSCGRSLEAVRLACPGCNIRIEGHFATSSLARLSAEQQEFVKIFVAARGNIKLVERVLGISYPSVRNRLDAVRRTLGLPDLAAGEQEQSDVSEVLDRVESGDLSVDDAIDSIE